MHDILHSRIVHVNNLVHFFSSWIYWYL